MNKEWISVILILFITGIVIFSYLTKEETVDESVAEDVPIVQKEETVLDKEVELDKLVKQDMQKPEMTIDKTKTYQAILSTNEGDITIDLNAKVTPVTVNNFVSLAHANFYNGTIFHRVMKGFMIQGGDPEGTGRGGPGYSFADEPFEGKYTRGTIAMANSGPNTNGSQFFIMHQDYPLPPNYVIFGKVSEGLNVVDAIAEAEVTVAPSGELSKPVKPVIVESVEIIEK